MSKLSPPFYPPRARWYSRFLYLGLTTRGRLGLDRIRLPKEINFKEVGLGLFIPGLAVYLRGPRFWGKLALAACASLFLLSILWLGYPFGNLAFGLMVSIHVSGFIYYCSPYLHGRGFSHRILFTLLVLAGIGLGFYLPIQHAVQRHWLMPVRNGNQVIIVSVQRCPAELKRGEWAAFVRDGEVFFGPIAGLAGERMDALTVPEGQWLIHAQYVRRYYHGDIPLFSTASDLVVQSEIVSREEFVGRPFHRWFWREQVRQ
jgi:hypothetical protein